MYIHPHKYTTPYIYITVTKLTGSNYAIWKLRMEYTLCCTLLIDPIESDGVKIDCKANKEWDKINKKIIG